ncbi:thioredoxin-like domain-containing protein [Wenyingzhuangia sp. IMCC45574]
MKRYIFLLFVAVQSLQAQNTVTGVFIDSLHGINDIALYRFEKGERRYVKYVRAEKDTFRIPMDSLQSGYYRVRYINKKTGRVDFIYNKENVEFTVHSKIGQESVSFLASRENQLMDSYIYNMQSIQQKLDSVQMAYFKNPKSDITKYQEIQGKIEGAQKYYEELAKNDYCLGVIKASKRYNAPIPFALPSDYIESTINHYFDFIDFSDQRIIDFTFLEKKVLEYVFKLHQSSNVGVENKLLVKAIDNVLSHATNDTLKEYVLKTIIKKLVEEENNEILQKTLALYKALPRRTQDIGFVIETEEVARVILGVIAPNIQINKDKTLYDLNTSNQYLVIFWSSTCSHCLKSLPKVKKIIEDANKQNLTVLAVGLEKEKDKAKWVAQSKKFSNWTHTISLGKWKSKAAKEYSINSTPSYFLLNSEKRIIAKPDDVKELKMILEK